MFRKSLVSAAAAVLVLCAAGGAALSRSLAQAGPQQSTALTPQALPPLPVREKGFPRQLAPVVEAEHAFARRSIERGMKPAFLGFAAPDGIIVNRRGPVNAIETWAQREPAPEGLLTWWPVYADVSRAGDLGWTTGPYEFREKPTDAKPADTGHFFTVWRRQPDGAWKFVLDLGVRHPAPEAPETALQYPARLKKSAPATAEFSDTAAARKSLLEAERAFSEESSKKGARAALLARADETLRMYRQGTFPVVGREAVARALKVDSELVTWEALKGDVAASGDLGYAYGTYEVKASNTQPAERGHYARVWRHDAGKWRVVFQVANPVPAQGQ
ncbi:MAG TPA: nuclear transport factor 2 family protein [Pyrinomonadaceae bacterium]|jgi:ketosteroid isomerase-like protein